ncbi:hypothetical protein [Mucilaginibacter phyllosphaerae]|uniref:Uncharacterized protein n=1 Tax=Mucilaginibacter phyllosphaerae TaxID=1812349 RepID=A0A4Y8ABF9_9SPHI|nr:hypothetical protein [Mucilaginibacter phyllosphaerae]MBB3969347.1 hypothetical protein [Mucilaginibacter phyllosphaerae]TEW65863.1 hypothetical protein E2R65_12055 [Mucilaginibacter phyllosphaerae]GGH07852.1 hypothetical protein GCM10007352_12770 [Mucilaginibacter phyllosphaerae]
MKHEEVVAALKKIAEKGVAGDISKDDLQELKSYNLIDFVEPDSKSKKQTIILTKKGRVMLKSNLK